MSEKTILIIDDEEIMHETIRDVLEDEPYTIFSTYNGEEGLAWAIQNHPDLIFLDLRMPVKTGFQFLQEYAASVGDATPIIVLTGHGTKKDKQLAHQLGSKFYLDKPFNIDDLRALITFELCMEGGND